MSSWAKGELVRDLGRARLVEPAYRDVVAAVYPRMLTRVTVARDLYDGILGVAQTYGLSGMIPNTLILGWGGDGDRPAEFTAMVRDALALDPNLLLVRHHPVHSFGARRTIDIWWNGRDRNGALMLLLAWFLGCTDDWEAARVRVNVALGHDAVLATARENLDLVLQSARVRAEANVILRDPATPMRDVITRESSEADLVLLGLPLPTEGDAEFVARIEALVGGLRTVVLVRAALRFDGPGMLLGDE